MELYVCFTTPFTRKKVPLLFMTLALISDPLSNNFVPIGALLFAERLGPSRRAALEGYQAPIFTLDALPPGYKETRFGKIRK